MDTASGRSYANDQPPTNSGQDNGKPLRDPKYSKTEETRIISIPKYNNLEGNCNLKISSNTNLKITTNASPLDIKMSVSKEKADATSKEVHKSYHQAERQDVDSKQNKLFQTGDKISYDRDMINNEKRQSLNNKYKQVVDDSQYYQLRDEKNFVEQNFNKLKQEYAQLENELEKEKQLRKTNSKISRETFKKEILNQTDSVRRIIDQITNEKNGLETEIIRLKNDRKKLQEKLITKENEYKNITQKYDNKLQYDANKYKDLKCKIEDLEKEMINQHEEINHLKENYNNKVSECSALVRDIGLRDKQITQLRETMNILAEENATLEGKLEVSECLEKNTEKYKSLETELVLQKSLNHTLQNDIRQLENEIDKKDKCIYQARNHNLHNNQRDLNVRHKQIKTLDDELKFQIEKIKKLENNILQVENLLDCKIRSHDKLFNDNLQLKDEMVNLKKKCDTLESELESRTSENKKLRCDINQLKYNLDNTEELYNKQKIHHQEYLLEKKQLKDNVDILKRTRDRLNENIMELKVRYGNKEKECGIVKDKKLQIKNRLKMVEKELENKISEIKQLCDDNQHLKNERVKNEKEWSIRIENLENELKKLTEKCENFQKELEEEKSKNINLENELEIKTKAFEDFDKKIRSLTEYNIGLKNELADEEKCLEKLQGDLHDVEQKLETNQNNNKQSDNNLKQELEIKVKCFSKLQEEFNNMKQKLAMEMQERENLKNIKEKLMNQIENDKKENSSKLKSLREKVKKLEQEIVKQKEEITEKNIKMKRFETASTNKRQTNDKYEDLLSENKKLQEQIKNLHMKIEILNKELSNKTEELNKLNIKEELVDVFENDDDLRFLNDENNILLNTNRNLENELKNSEEKLEEILRDYDKKLGELETQLKDKSIECENLRTKLAKTTIVSPKTTPTQSTLTTRASMAAEKRAILELQRKNTNLEKQNKQLVNDLKNQHIASTRKIEEIRQKHVKDSKAEQSELENLKKKLNHLEREKKTLEARVGDPTDTKDDMLRREYELMKRQYGKLEKELKRKTDEVRRLVDSNVDVRRQNMLCAVENRDIKLMLLKNIGSKINEKHDSISLRSM